MVSLTTHPICRASLEIHDRENPDTIWLDLVEKGVRESLEQATADGTTEDRPSFGMVLNGLYAPVDLLEEGGPEPRVLEVVVLRRLVQFSVREPVELGSVHSFQLGPGVPKHIGGWPARTWR